MTHTDAPHTDVPHPDVPHPETPRIRTIIVDDEALARSYLAELLEEHPEIEIVAQCPNGFEAVKAVRDLAPALILLDIQMPKLNGFEVLELLEPPCPAVIFVTAYDEYALKAFEVHALDYLLKPFSAARLSEALTVALARVGSAPMAPAPTAPAPTTPSPVGPTDASQLAADARPPERFLSRIVVRDGATVVVIPTEKLDYVEAQDDYVALHSGGQSWLKNQTITSLAAALDPARFVRIHRSTIVNLERVARVEPYTKDTRVAILSDGTQLAISRTGYKRLKEILDDRGESE